MDIIKQRASDLGVHNIKAFKADSTDILPTPRNDGESKTGAQKESATNVGYHHAIDASE